MIQPHISRLLLLLSLLPLLGCGDSGPSILIPFAGEDCPGKDRPEKHEERWTIKQGVWGNTWFWKGDFMPVCESGTVTAVSREVLFYEPVTRGAARQATDSTWPSFYEAVTAPVVATTVSDSDGFFQMPLTAGTYSVFIKENGYYLGRGRKDDLISPVTVEEGASTYMQFDITYKATY